MVAELKSYESFQLRLNRAIRQVQSAARQLIEPTQMAVEKLRLAAESLKSIDFSIQVEPIQHFNCRSIADVTLRSRGNYIGCAGCLYYDENPYLHCAVHPLGPPGTDCNDWEDGGTKTAQRWRIRGERRALEAECSASGRMTADLLIRMDQNHEVQQRVRGREMTAISFDEGIDL